MRSSIAITLALLAISMFAIGCTNPDANKNGSADVHSESDGHDDHDHDHDHAAHDHTPKHGGHLIEIGRNHEYHAELVDDHKTETVTVYMLDSHMEALTVKQASISLVLTAGDNTQTFELMASQPGGSDHFTSNDTKLMEMLDNEDVQGKLRVTIGGKPFSGTFDHHAHDHDHEGHDHEGHNHDGHKH